MKTLLKTVLIMIGVSFILSGCTGSYIAQSGGGGGAVTYQVFYDNLSPYGTWIDYPGYGNVWAPAIDGDFRPYDTNGYWVWSDLGWAWNSGFSWGWGPFHYGRWFYDDFYGWLWVPGYSWAPAWVTWGYFGDYYCWAPLMPGVNVAGEFAYWRPPSFYWNACSRNHIYDRNLGQNIQRPDQIGGFSNRIEVIRNFSPTRRQDAYYSKGPDVKEVQRYVQPTIKPATIRDARNVTEIRQNDNELDLFRPQVQDPKVTSQRPDIQPVQPSGFRTVTPNNVRPFVREDQKRPELQRSNQMDNIRRLPEVRPGNTLPGNNDSKLPRRDIRR